MKVRVRNVVGTSFTLIVAGLNLAMAAFTGFTHFVTVTQRPSDLSPLLVGVTYVVGFTTLSITFFLLATIRVLNEMYPLTGCIISLISSSIMALSIVDEPLKWVELGMAAAVTIVGLFFTFLPRSNAISRYILPYRVLKIDQDSA